MREQQVKAFVATARSGSFAAAARVLSLPASTVRRHVGALETELDAQLLVRRPDILRLTAAGSTYFVHAPAILRAFASARSAARDS